jgi:hypothetical protein
MIASEKECHQSKKQISKLMRFIHYFLIIKDNIFCPAEKRITLLR